MFRHCLLIAGFFAATTYFGGGCRSCSDCHDYDPPVQGCECAGYGQRTGSVSCCDSCGPGGCASGGCTTGGCGCGNHGGYYQDGPAAQPQQYLDQRAVEEVEEVGT